MPAETLQIPLFPLNVVLFPGARIPLRIFEERYKRLYEDSLKGGAAFGIVLIKEGQEVGGPATPFDVGTLAEIEAVDHHKDNLFVLCRGTRRFRIRELKHDKPYLVGTVELLEEPASTPQEEQAARELSGLFEEYLGQMRDAARALWGGELQTPRTRPGPGAREIAYGVAFTLAMDPAEKQSLLEEEGLQSLIERLHELLQREIRFLTPDADASQ